MNYLLDTNIFISYSRSNDMAAAIEKEFELFNFNNNLFISAVTLGEIDSLIKQNQYGIRRRSEIANLLKDILSIEINTPKITKTYGNIDAYSKGKLKTRTSNFSARNMGKNDLWIAATASAFDLTLITTDKDFNHLDNTFLDLKYVDLSNWTKLL